MTRSMNLNKKQNFLLQNIVFLSILKSDHSADKLNDKKINKLLKERFSSPEFVEAECRLMEAIHLFREKDSIGIVSMAFDCFDKANSKINWNEIIEKFSSKEFFHVMIAIANEVFQENRLKEAKNMFAMIAILFPNEVKPYIFMAIAEWEENGIEAGMIFYEQLIKNIHDPLLLFCAAECFWIGKRKNKALDALKLASHVLEGSFSFDERDIKLESAIENFAVKIAK